MPAVQFNIVCTCGIKVNRMVDIAGQNGGFDCYRLCDLLFLWAMVLPILKTRLTTSISKNKRIAKISSCLEKDMALPEDAFGRLHFSCGFQSVRA